MGGRQSGHLPLIGFSNRGDSGPITPADSKPPTNQLADVNTNGRGNRPPNTDPNFGVACVISYGRPDQSDLETHAVAYFPGERIIKSGQIYGLYITRCFTDRSSPPLVDSRTYRRMYPHRRPIYDPIWRILRSRSRQVWRGVGFKSHRQGGRANPPTEIGSPIGFTPLQGASWQPVALFGAGAGGV